MNIIGLDLSLLGTGFACADRAGVLAPPKTVTGFPRLKWILDSVWNITEGADLVVIESFLFSAKGSSFAELTGLGTLVRFTMWENGRRFVDVNNQTLKMFATGKGSAKKPDMLEAAIRKLGWLGSNNDNVIDAVWLREIALAHYEHRQVTQKQKEAIGKVGWPTFAQASSA